MTNFPARSGPGAGGPRPWRIPAGPGRGSCPWKAGAENSLVLGEFSSERQGAGLAPVADSPALNAEEGYGEERVKDVQRAGRCGATQLASIRQMSGQVSRGSAGEYQADEQ